MTIQLVIDSKFNSQGVKQAEAEMKRLVTDVAQMVSRSLQTSGGSADSFINQFRGPSPEDVRAIEQQIQKIQQFAEALRQKALASAAAGNNQLALGLQKESEAADRTAESLKKLIAVQEESNNAQDKGAGVLDFINNKFNKFAFGLFVVTGAINTVSRAIKQMTDFLIEGASAADRANSFRVLIDDTGASSGELANKLREASQGAITLDAAMRPTLQLMKAGVPEVAGMSDQLLKIAVASATLSGDLSQVEHMYTTLVRGIVRGSPLLIDNADIYLKLGDAVENYAEKMNMSIDDMTPEDRIRATAQAVLEQGDAIVQLAEDVDSSAQSLQAFKTDATEAWNEIKMAIGTGASDAIEALDDLMDMFDPITEGFGRLVAGSEEVGFALERALDARPIQSFVQGILTSLDLLGSYVRGYGAELTEIWNAVVSVFVTGATLIAEGFQMIASGNYEEGIQNINQQLDVFKARVTDAMNPTNQLNAELDGARDRARQAGEEMGLFASETERAGAAADSTANSTSRLLSSDLAGLTAGIQAAIEARTGLDAQYRDRKQDIEEDIREKVLDINEDLAEKLADINQDLQEKLVDIGNKYKEDVTNLAQETAEKLQDIDEDLSDKLADISEDAGEKRKDAIKGNQKGIEDAHEAHQKKLRDIERKYEAARLKALIDRDARALFEAEQNRKQEKEEANEDLQDKIKEEKEKLEEQMEEINEMEEKRRQEAIEAAEKRRQDALEAQQKELDDLKKALQKQKEEAAKNAADQRRDALESANERRADAQEHYRDALVDLDEWYREQLLRQKEANLQRKINELEHLEEMGELTQAHLDELRGMWNDYNSFVGGASGGGGGSSGGGSIGDFAPGAGGSNPGGGQIGGKAPANSQINNWQMQNMKLQITSNDKTLEEVLRSSTYDYMLETLEE